MTLLLCEIEAAAECPEILRHLADWHDCKATEADAIGEFESSVEFHENRANNLRMKADKLEKEL